MRVSWPPDRGTAAALLAGALLLAAAVAGPALPALALAARLLHRVLPARGGHAPVAPGLTIDR